MNAVLLFLWNLGPWVKIGTELRPFQGFGTKSHIWDLIESTDSTLFFFLQERRVSSCRGCSENSLLWSLWPQWWRGWYWSRHCQGALVIGESLLLYIISFRFRPIWYIDFEVSDHSMITKKAQWTVYNDIVVFVIVILEAEQETIKVMIVICKVHVIWSLIFKD